MTFSVKPDNSTVEKLKVTQLEGNLAIQVTFSDNTEKNIRPIDEELVSLFSQYVDMDGNGIGDSKPNAFTAIGGNWFTNNVYALVKLLADNPDAITNVIVDTQTSSCRKAVAFNNKNAIEKLMEPKDVSGKSKPQEPVRPNGNRPTPQTRDSQQQPQPKEDNNTSNEALREIATILQNQFGIKMDESQHTDSSMLLNAIKTGLKQLLESKQKTAQGNDAEKDRLRDALNQELKDKDQELEKNDKELKAKDDEIKSLTQQALEQMEEAEKCKKNAENLQASVKQLENEKKQLENENARLKASTFDVKGELLKAVDALIADLEKGDYICYANGDPLDNTFFEKQAKELKEAVEKVQTNDVNQMRADFKEILKAELRNQDRVLNVMARYYAYSRLPFMIEPKDEGMYLVPLRTTSIYNKVIALLAPYGLHQNLPQLFVETVEDGEYTNVTSSTSYVSNLSTMCPSYDRHKRLVDREQKESVIKDIVKVGFSEDGRAIEPTQVIV